MSEPSPPATPVFRAVVAVIGVAFTLAGGWSVGTSLEALSAMVNALDRSVFGWREVLFLTVWLVFAISLVIAAMSMLRSAWRGRRRNIVPGPTLYVAGASLMIIALFMLEAGAVIPFALTAGFGLLLMIAEYRMDVV